MAPARVRRASELKELLDDAYDRLACPGFVADDPIQVPRSFSQRSDAEIMGFLTATIAWGQRKTIIANALRLGELLDQRPFDFVMHATTSDLSRLDRYVHRTFNAIDLRDFIFGLRHLYLTYGGIEDAFLDRNVIGDMSDAISRFKQRFFEREHERRTEKHVADPSKGSNAKRINLFLRWMVRPLDRGIDLGLWERIPTSALHVPLDVHSGRVARELGLLARAQDDWKAVVELTEALRAFDPVDPVKYDIALFGLGVGTAQRPQIRRVIASRPFSSVARNK